MRQCIGVIVVCSGVLFAQNVVAEEKYMYQCKSSKGVINFGDKPCGKKEKEIGYKKLPEAALMHSVVVSAPQSNSQRQYSYNVDNHCQRVNVMAINQKYDTMVFDARYAHQRDAEKARLQQVLSHIEWQRRQELQGCA